MQWTGVIRDVLSIVFALERTNQLSLLPDKDLVDLCPPIEPYQVTKNHFTFFQLLISTPKINIGAAEKVCWWRQGVGCGVWGVGCRVLPILR